MKVVILCGGFGTRIRDVAQDIPKPLVPVGGFPILWHIMKYYSCYGHNDFILCLGYKSNVIKDYFFNYEMHSRDFTLDFSKGKSVVFHDDFNQFNWRITFAETGLESGTGGRIRRIRRYLEGEENFMLTYGDGVGNVDLNSLEHFHTSHGKTLTVTGVYPPGRFGEIKEDENGLITEFNEKPQATGGRISGGFFVCRHDLFDHLDDRDDLTFEEEPVRSLVRNQEMMVYRHDGFWMPMDTFRDYKLLNSLCEKGQAPWMIWK